MFPSSSRQAIKALTFHPGAKYPDGLRLLEITLPGARNSPQIIEQNEYEDSIASWIDKDGKDCFRSPASSGLRVIFAGRTGLSNLFDQFPFSEATFETILRDFELPSTYPAILSSRLPHFAHSRSRNKAGDLTLSFISRTFSFRRAGHALALTYNTRTEVTSAILQGPRDSKYIARLSGYLKERSDLSSHPAYLLLAVAQLEYETTDENYVPLRDDMIHIENWTGHGTLITRPCVNLTLSQELSPVTRELNLFSSRVIAESERVKSCILRHELILNFIDIVDKTFTVNPPSESCSGSAELREHAEMLASGWKSMLHRYEAFEKNVQVQLAVLYNTAVQRDSKLNLDVAKSSASIAAASKRDGSVMKSISLLTMLFLPATFVSTLFAMPLFNWSAEQVSAIATPHAWIYLAVALPLTIAVVSVWFLWLWFNKTMRQQDASVDSEEDFSPQRIDVEKETP